MRRVFRRRLGTHLNGILPIVNQAVQNRIGIGGIAEHVEMPQRCSTGCSTRPSSCRSRAPADRLRQHAELMPEHVRSKAILTPPIPAQTPRRRGRPPKSAYAHPAP